MESPLAYKLSVPRSQGSLTAGIAHHFVDIVIALSYGEEQYGLGRPAHPCLLIHTKDLA